jgi:hypothetical protein
MTAFLPLLMVGLVQLGYSNRAATATDTVADGDDASSSTLEEPTFGTNGLPLRGANPYFNST